MELPLDRQVPHSGSWEDAGEVRHRYVVELDLNGQVKLEVLEDEAQEATNGESAEELAATLELVSNDFLPPWTLFNISCYRKRLSQPPPATQLRACRWTEWPGGMTSLGPARRSLRH